MTNLINQQEINYVYLTFLKNKNLSKKEVVFVK